MMDFSLGCSYFFAFLAIFEIKFLEANQNWEFWFCLTESDWSCAFIWILDERNCVTGLREEAHSQNGPVEGSRMR